MAYSEAYFDLKKRGPFPQAIDLWAEAARYWHQIHGGMIGKLLDVLQEPLERRGYLAGRETSLQILERREPDIFIQNEDINKQTRSQWDYQQAAQAVASPVGELLTYEQDELDHLVIKDMATNQLVTIVEVVSPSNKASLPNIEAYQQRRQRFLQQQVHIVEIDLTRSQVHLIGDMLARTSAYHIAVHLYDQPGRFIGMPLFGTIPRFALPLHQDVIAIDLHNIYRYAYEVARIATHIQNEGGYTAHQLPYPSTLTQGQRADAMQRVQQWQMQLAQLTQS